MPRQALPIATTQFQSAVCDKVEASGIRAYIYVRNLKIEKGSVATDWTPAPEDIEAQLADTGIDIANHKIVLSADKTVFRNNSGTDRRV